MTLLLSHWIFLGWLLALYFALQSTLTNKSSVPTQSTFYGIALLLALALLQFSYWLRINDLQQTWPFTFYLHQPILYAIGPLLYFYTESLQGNAPSESQVNFHLGPAYVIAAISITEWRIRGASAPLELSPLLYCLSFGTGAFYARRVMHSLRSFAHPASLILFEINVMRVTVGIGIAVVILAMLGSLFSRSWFYPLHSSAITVLMLFAFYIQQRYPGLTHQVVEEIAAEAEQRTKPRITLSNVDIDQTLSRLRHMMEIDKRFTDDNLDLPTLAAELTLTTHQLSHLINEHLGINYTRFIKEYRIREAKRLLIEHPLETVLNIALQVGFNSLSSFHAAFRELEGTTPGSYRKKS